VFHYAFAVWRPSIDALGDWRYLARHRFSRGKPMMSFLSGRRLYRQQLVSAHDWIAQANRSTSIAIAPRFWQNEAKMLNLFNGRQIAPTNNLGTYDPPEKVQS
jgi:hypothetical protein